MERIYIVGDPDIKDIADSLGAEFISIPTNHAFNSSEIHDYMVSSFTQDIRAIVLDVESNPSFCLDLAMHVRLSLSELGINSLCPIILLTNLGVKSLLSVNSNSQIVLTDSVYIASFSDLQDRLNSVIRMKIEDYDRRFLSKITINPPSSDEHDSHALANEWGASALFRSVTGSYRIAPECDALRAASKKLYFKYVIAKSSDDIQSLALHGKQVVLKDYIQDNLTVNAHSRRVLLIDDKAEYGWSYILSLILRGAQIDTINERVRCFEEFSATAKEKILNEEYDLYLLDLRLSGADEDDVKDPSSFSGMKVLKEIKKVNWGRQVIMFTASNKAWNLKALMHPSAGANGYYIKESPLSGFSETVTRKNLSAFCQDIENCFQRSYLKKFFQIKKRLSPLLKRKDKSIQECYTQLNIAFDSADRAATKEQFKYAFISIFQIFELLNKNLTRENRDKDPGKLILQVKDSLSSNDQDWKDAKSVVQDSASRIRSKYELSPSNSIAMRFRGEKFSVHEKLSTIYLQLLKKEDNGILFLLWEIIEMRNTIIHGFDPKRNPYSNYPVTKPVFYDTYKHLTVMEDAELREIIDEMIDKGLIKGNNSRVSQANFPFLFHPNTANSRLGIQLALYCLNVFFQNY